MPRVAILSRHAELYSTRRLLAAVVAAGAEPVLLQPEQCLLMLHDTQAALYYGSSPLAPCAAVVPRVGTPITRLGARLLRYFAGEGSCCLNSAEALELSRDKFASLQVLAAAGVAVPQTAYFTQAGQRDLAVSFLGMPLVHKLLSGSQGVGVSLADTPAAARGMLDTVLHLQHEAMAQRFLSGRQDIRVIVLFGRVIAAMRREASAEDFRSNLHWRGAGVGIARSARRFRHHCPPVGGCPGPGLRRSRYHAGRRSAASGAGGEPRPQPGRHRSGYGAGYRGYAGQSAFAAGLVPISAIAAVIQSCACWLRDPALPAGGSAGPIRTSTTPGHFRQSVRGQKHPLFTAIGRRGA
ncbi:alpha-L-glutamate ligase, RimK family protein [Acidithiobacillus sp. GGI-221]|nr:alpha-L-glutamate ligase, RimK family protein [Acidithiobacillus sp. GGI-221]